VTVSGRIAAFVVVALLAAGVGRAAKNEVWIEVKSPHFVVICNGSDKQARRVIGQFERFRALIQKVLPKMRVDPSTPLTIFAVKDENSLRTLLPEFWEQKDGARPPGVFQGGPEKNYVVLRMNLPGEHAYHVIYHEYVHLLMRLNLPALPVWLNEGLAEFFGHATLSDKESGIGRPSIDQLNILRQARLLPMAALFTADHSSPYYREAGKISVFYAQSWALTHYFMIGDKGARFRQLADYIQMMQDGTAEDEAVGRAFGNLAQLERQLERYVGRLSFYYLRVPTPAGADPKHLPVRTLSLAEVLAARGDFFTYSARLPQARLMLEQALRLDPQSPAAHESLGLLYLRQGDREKAAPHFSEAVKLDSRSFLAHFYAAEAAHETGAEGLDATERHLRKAIEINPDFVPAYSNLVGVLTARGRNLEEALQLAVQATKLEPGVLRHKMGVARVLMALQRGEEAQRLAEQALGAARTEVDRAEAEALLATLKRYEQQLAEVKRHQEEARARQQELEERRRALEEEERKARELAARFRDTGDGRPTKPEQGRPEENRPDGGATAAVEGRVRAVRCEAPAVMVLSLEVRGNSQEFRAENFYAVQYRAVGRANRGDFRPCEELEGMSVRIEYLPTPETPYTGEILIVRILN